MPAIDPVTPEPRRFSIRLPRPMWIGVAAGVLVVLVVALRVGIPIYRQQVAIREIERLGGWVLTEERGPNWLRRWVGDKATTFGLATSAVFTETKITDADLVVLAPQLRNFERLILARTHITDAGLIHLRGLTDLRELDLDDTDISDAGLVHLKTMTGLKELGLYGTQVTESGVSMLQKALPRVKIRIYPLARAAPAVRRYEFAGRGSLAITAA
jgi:hypothetical protein